jgi:hypothetical protein
VEFNRNHYFLGGVLLLLVGLQFRYVHTYVLSSEATAWISQMRGAVSIEKQGLAQRLGNKPPAPVKKALPVPHWLGYAVMAIGAVLVLQSFAMGRPAP